jgi:hypothetical protein
LQRSEKRSKHVVPFSIFFFEEKQMSKDDALFGGQQAGQPATASVGEPAQQAGQQPDFSALIHDAIAKTVPSVIDQALEQFSRKQQSQRDQQEARISKKVQEALEFARIGGAEPTPEQQATIRQRVERAEASVSEIQAPPSQAAPGQAQPSGDGVDDEWKTGLNAELAEVYGTKLERGDPELATYKDTNNPAEFTKQLKTALKAKKARLEGEASGRLGVLPSSGPASPNNPIETITDPGTLLKMGFNQNKK